MPTNCYPPLSTISSPSVPQVPFISLVIILNFQKRPNAPDDSASATTFPCSLAALGALDQNRQITLLIAGFTAVSFQVLNYM